MRANLQLVVGPARFSHFHHFGGRVTQLSGQNSKGHVYAYHVSCINY